MKTFFLIIQLLSVICLTSLILLQSSKGGLQSQIGGADFYRTKRGADKIIFIATIVCASIFFLITIINSLIA